MKQAELLEKARKAKLELLAGNYKECCNVLDNVIFSLSNDMVMDKFKRAIASDKAQQKKRIKKFYGIK